jgi:hypothetical protein
VALSSPSLLPLLLPFPLFFLPPFLFILRLPHFSSIYLARPSEPQTVVERINMKSVIFLTLASVFASLATATDDFCEFSVPATKIDYGEFSVPATQIEYDESDLVELACEASCLVITSESGDIDKCKENCLNDPVGASSLLLQWCIMLTVVQNFLPEVTEMYIHCQRECSHVKKHFMQCVRSCINQQ